jgi:hypothetical protein
MGDLRHSPEQSSHHPCHHHRGRYEERHPEADALRDQPQISDPTVIEPVKVIM